MQTKKLTTASSVMLTTIFVPKRPNGKGAHGMLAAQDCTYQVEETSDNINQERTPSQTPETIDIDPALTGAPQRPIPSFSSLNGRWPRESNMPIIERIRLQAQSGGQTRFFGSSLMQDLINPDDMSLSSEANQPSDRPTPNSITSASERQQCNGDNSATGASSAQSRHNSFQASPASSSAHKQQDGSQQQQNNASRTAEAFLREFQGTASGLSTGMSPGGERPFAVPETPKNVLDGSGTNDEFSWDSFAAGGTGMTPGMTPMSEGVLRTMLQIGPMETMDLGWDNPP